MDAYGAALEDEVGGPVEPAGDNVAADYTHPSQAGNDVIRDLLVEAHLS